MYINGLKYACSTCIKGHRSSHCSHVDRPLFEIRKKGRPVTQCTFCRDLRKTKQVHIKCACGSDKKAAATTATTTATASAIIDPQQATFRTSSPCNGSNDVCQDNQKSIGTTGNHGQHCACVSNSSSSPVNQSQLPGVNIASPMIRLPSSSSNNYNQHQDSPSQMEVTQEPNSSLLAPLCPTPPQLVKEENLSYSWALITSPSANHIDLPSSSNPDLTSPNLFADMMLDNNSEIDGSNNYQHLGFIFHKPTSTQRFLDGQPRVRRRRSTNQKRTMAANSTSVTPTNYANNATRLPVNALVDPVLSIDTMNDYSLSTPPSSAVSPHPLTSASFSAAANGGMEPMDVQFDYLTEQLKILSSDGVNNGGQNGFMGDLTNAEELTAILNNVLQKDDDDVSSLPSASSSTYSGGGNMDAMNTSPMNTTIIPTTTPTNGAVIKKKKDSIAPTLNRSHCGSFVPRSKCCKPIGSVGGESVVITIAPLTNTSNVNDSNNTSMMMMLEDDRQQQITTRIVTCYCGNQCTCPGCLVHPSNFFLGSDPYAGLVMNPSSSASSSCYGSDEEGSIYNSNKSNFMPF